MKKLVMSVVLLLGVCFILLTAENEKVLAAPVGKKVNYSAPEQHKNKKEPVTVTVNGTKFTYQPYGKGIEIIDVQCSKEKLVVPAKLNGKRVYKIERIFVPTIRKVVIKNGIQEIGESAFGGLHKLTSVTIPKSVKKIGITAFYRAPIKEIKFQNLSVKIGESAFWGCRKLEKVSFPKGEFTGKIGESAFEYSSLRGVKLPYMKNMKKQVGRFAFADNKRMKKVTFSSRQKKVSLGEDWFTDCPNAKIIVGKQVKTFSSKVNANAGTVQLLGRQTKLTGFKKPKDRSYYYIQFKKFIVPKGSKAIPVLKNAKYGTVSDSRKDRYSGEKNYYFSTSEADMHKVKIVKK